METSLREINTEAYRDILKTSSSSQWTFLNDLKHEKAPPLSFKTQSMLFFLEWLIPKTTFSSCICTFSVNSDLLPRWARLSTWADVVHKLLQLLRGKNGVSVHTRVLPLTIFLPRCSLRRIWVIHGNAIHLLQATPIHPGSRLSGSLGTAQSLPLLRPSNWLLSPSSLPCRLVAIVQEPLWPHINSFTAQMKTAQLY